MLHAAADTAGYERVNQAAGFAGGWDLDIFGKYRRQIEATLDDAEAAADDREGVLIAVVADVARAYLDLRAFQARLVVARESVDAGKRNLDLVQARAKEGITNDLDVALAQRQLSTFEAAIPPLEGDIDAAKYVIAVLLGRYPEDMTAELLRARPIPAFPARIAVGTPLELLRRRPDVQEAERLLAAATARIGVATADLYPDLSVSGAFGAQGGTVAAGATPLTYIAAAGPALMWPVLDFGTLDARVDIADLQTKEQLARYKRTVLQAVEQVDEAAASYRAQEDKLRDLDRAIAAAKQAVTLSRDRYDRGLTDFLNVIDAERQLYALQAQYVQAQQDAAEQLVRLYKALGGGWETYQAVPPIRKPQPAIAAAVNRALAPKNIHEYLKTSAAGRSEVIVARQAVLAAEIGADPLPRKIQAKANLAKFSQIQPRQELRFPCPNRAFPRTYADPPGRFSSIPSRRRAQPQTDVAPNPSGSGAKFKSLPTSSQ